MARPQPDRVAEPVVQRLRIRYAKRGRLRFSSHRDFQRAFERAVRRAGIPVAYSAGFSPHPRISYTNAAPTGIGSEAEYLEMALTRAVDLASVQAALDAALPPDLDIVDVIEARSSDFADRMEASVWRIELPGATAEVAQDAVSLLLAAEVAEVSRLTKQGIRTFDVRSAVLRLTVESRSEDNCAILRLVVRHTTPAVRPDDVLQALASVGSLTLATPPRVTRCSQGPLTADASDVSDPFAPDRV